MRLQLLLRLKQHPLLWVYPIYFMNLPLLQANTHEEANTPSLTGYLFRTMSREIRLALGTAQLSSLGQHRSTAFLCWVLPELGSSRPCIPSAKGIVLHGHVPEVAFSLASSHLSGATHKSVMRTCPPPSICMLVKAESEHKQISRVQHCPVCPSPTPVCTTATWMRIPRGPTTSCSRDLGMRVWLISPGVLSAPESLFFRERETSPPHNMGWVPLPASHRNGEEQTQLPFLPWEVWNTAAHEPPTRWAHERHIALGLLDNSASPRPSRG